MTFQQKKGNSLTQTQQIGIPSFLCHNSQKYSGSAANPENNNTLARIQSELLWVPWDQFQGERGDLSYVINQGGVVHFATEKG